MLLSKIIPSLVIITSVFVPSISPRLKAQTLISINYPEPPEQTERNTNNDGTAGGGARNPPNACKPIVPIALVPKDGIVTTASKNVNLYWYIPVTTSSQAEFTLSSENDEEIIKIKLDLPQENKIVKFTLPENISLQRNQLYKWNLETTCEADGNYYIIEGKIKHIILTTEQIQKLEKAATQIAKAQLYTQYYLWNETLETVSNIKETEPQQWQQLLTSVGINQEYIHQASIINITDN